MAAGVLAGRRVVVTRAADQADSLADALRAAGAEPVVVPLLEIVPEPAGVDALAALDPSAFDWLAVTSPNGAQAYLAAHPGATPRHVAAVGTATAAALAAGGLQVDLVPARQLAAGLLAELPAGPASALVVQAVDAEDTLAAGLAERGWKVTAVAPYRSVPARPSTRLQLAALAADAVLFASGSAARAWVAVFGTSTPPITVAIGPRAEAAAVAAGLKITLVAADHSVPGMVTALEQYLSRVQ